MKSEFLNRLKYLWTWELLNALVVVPGTIALLRLNMPLGHLSLVATLAVSAMLLVGSGFAWIKYQAVLSGKPIDTAFRPLFTALRLGVPCLFPIIGLFFWTTCDDATSADRLVGSIMAILSVLEYVNYFHMQLMYDNQADWDYLRRYKRLKRGIIAREFW